MISDTTLQQHNPWVMYLKINSSQFIYCISRRSSYGDFFFYQVLNSTLLLLNPKSWFLMDSYCTLCVVIFLALFGVNVFYFSYRNYFSWYHRLVDLYVTFIKNIALEGFTGMTDIFYSHVNGRFSCYG
jgi:hypothetical protein